MIAPLLRDARLLRNRVSHFEHVAFDASLPRFHRLMADLIAWMHPQIAELSDIGDDFLLVYGKTWTDWPAGTVTVAGTGTSEEVVANFTTLPLGPAIPASVTVMLTLLPPTRVAGEMLRLDRGAGNKNN